MDADRAAVQFWIDDYMERACRIGPGAATEMDAILALLAGLRERCIAFLRDPNVVESGNVALVDFARSLMNAAADGLADAVPLLPTTQEPR